MTLEHYDTPSIGWQQRLRPWRALPRLLVSREWRWLTLGALALAFLLIQLGNWQLDRREQRRTRNALVEARINAAPVALTGQPLNPAAEEFRRVTVRGEYDPANEIVLRNRAFNGIPGMDILTPLRIAGSDQSVLINRGWVPMEQAEQTRRAQFAVSGPVEIEGIVRQPQLRSGGISPEDRRSEGGRLDAWFRVDTARISEQVPYPLLPLYIEQLPRPDQPDLPKPHPDIDTTTEGPHLGYALQWYSFAAIGLCGYAAFVVTRSQQADARQQAQR